jgi:hypothetical protein
LPLASHELELELGLEHEHALEHEHDPGFPQVFAAGSKQADLLGDPGAAKPPATLHGSTLEPGVPGGFPLA